MRYFFFLVVFLSTFFGLAQTDFPENEDGIFEDMLTPGYYLSEKNSDIRNEINEFIFFARQIPFHHPLADSCGNLPENKTPVWGHVGAGKGPNRTQQHHAAIDIHVGNRETKVNLFASHDGLVQIYRDAPKYRHYISVTTDVKNGEGQILGKMVTIYGHVDLDLDSLQNMQMNGKEVKKGDLISKNLYAETVGGPHLHFEIRYYRKTELGTEEFYGFSGMAGSESFTQSSAGPWSFGIWDPNIAFGYANPKNYLNKQTTGILFQENELKIGVYPNHAKKQIIIDFLSVEGDYNISLHNLLGQKVFQKNYSLVTSVKINCAGFQPGIYCLLVLQAEENKVNCFKPRGFKITI